MTPYKTQTLKNLELQLKDIEAKINKYKMELIQEMEEVGTKTFEDKNIKVTYVDSTTRISLDSNKVKSLYNDIYLQCTKETYVKPTIRIELKA